MKNMENEIYKVIEKIVNIPQDFYNRKNVSELALLQESGYFEFYNQIAEGEIIEKLKKHPHFIAAWLQWSEDNRSSFKWYFIRDEEMYFVKHWPEGKEFQEIMTTDEFKACAAFIKREIESIRIK